MEMSRPARVILLICLYAGVVYAGMDCPVGKDSLLDKVAGYVAPTCPRPLLDSSDKSYCCYDIQRDMSYCCDVEEFAKTGLAVIIPVIVGAVVLIGLIVCCISCLCCSWCPWYRRRHRGTVYGKVHTPIVQVIQPSVNLPPSYPSQTVENNYTPYPTNSTGMPQPPSYTNEAYAKQAPYNPAYPAPQ